MNALHLETAPRDFSEQDAIAFIDHVAVPETIIARQRHRFIRHDDQQVSFGFPDWHCLTLTQQPDGWVNAELFSRHRRDQVSANYNPVIPLLKLNGGEFGIIRSAWHAVGDAGADDLRRRLNQYLGHNYRREHEAFDNRYVKPSPGQPLSLDDAFNNAVIRTRAAATGLGYYPQLERLAFGLIYRLVGRDVVRAATRILGPQATLHHANALIGTATRSGNPTAAHRTSLPGGCSTMPAPTTRRPSLRTTSPNRSKTNSRRTPRPTAVCRPNPTSVT